MNFIKVPAKFNSEYSLSNHAPRFRKVFTVSAGVRRATLRCAGLGLGYFYINGKPVSADRFTAPPSNYNKTVWYNEYDVTELIRCGENVAAAILGNGFYNESFKSLAKVNTASWRDNPKMFFELSLEYPHRTETVASDDTWRCTNVSPIVFNMLRSGECYDARLYEKGWNTPGFDDSLWSAAEIDNSPPLGILRKCECEPIREFEVYPPSEIVRTGEKRYLFKFPQTISGYISLRTCGLTRGQKLIIRYAECINRDGSLDFKIADSPKFYPESRFAWDEFIADGEDFTWSPRFAYHGFRYIQIDGFDTPPEANTVSAVFVHQDILQKASFTCSDPRLNRLYDMGIKSTLANMFYMPTDCPSREKLGWANDAQSSTEQFLINFQAETVLQKWFQDILDAMREDGSLPGVVPTENYGYEWGAGPTSTGVLFEIPYQIYRYTGNSKLMTSSLSSLKKHLEYIKSNSDESGLINYGLCDWAGPWDDPQNSPTPKECSNTLLYMKFLKIHAFAAKLAGNREEEMFAENEYARIRDVFLKFYINEDGSLKIAEQCALSLAIVLDICEDIAVLAKQLIEVIERDNFHINCGMLGIRYIFRALDKICRPDLSFKLICAEGFPGYMHWIEEFDATTLLEMWSGEKSHNHHMYSDALVWLMTTLGGISLSGFGAEEYTVKPYFPGSLSWCSASRQTSCGLLKTDWQRCSGKIHLKITVPENLNVLFEDTLLSAGENSFFF